MRAPSSGYVVVAALVCAAALPARAGAEAAAPTDAEKEARRLFQKAELSFNLGKFEDALGDYQAAYQAKPLTGFLFNIAQCYRNLGNWERARFFYRRYLTLEPRSPNRHRVEDLVSEMTARLDKQAQAPAPTPAPPAAPSSASDSPEPGSTPVPVAPPPAAVPALPEPKVPAASAADVSGASATLVASPAPEPQRAPVYKRWWFWTGVGAVVAGGVVAAFVLTRPTTQTPGTLDPIDGR